MQKVSPQIMPNVTNYKSVEEFAPKYRYMRIPLNNFTGTSVTITPTATQTLEFKLPIGVYNLARSKIVYCPSFAAAGSPVGGTYGYNLSFEDVVELAQYAYFGTGGGLGICDLNYANNWTKIARQIKSKYQDLVTMDTTNGLYSVSNNIAITTLAGNNYPYQYAAQAGNIYGIGAGNTFTALRFEEPQHISIGAVEAGAGESIINRNRVVPLSAWKDTIFEVDKDLYFPIEMYIRFWAGPGNKMGFRNTGQVAAPATNAVVPNNITLNNLVLYLAVEQNEIIANSVIDKVKNGGMTIQIPYTVAFRNPSATTAVNFQIPLNRQYGKRLKRMLWSVWNGTEQANTAYDNHNWNGAKISTYQTYLDSRPLQDFQLSCAQPVLSNGAVGGAINSDDWRENERFLKDSVLMNMGLYQLNWHHSDYFYEPNRHTHIAEENIDEGLDMDTSHLWQVQATAPNSNAIVHYNFATFVRDLKIHPTGPPTLE